MGERQRNIETFPAEKCYKIGDSKSFDFIIELIQEDMIQFLYCFGILGLVRAKLEIIKDLGLAFEQTEEYILGNGAFEFDLEINHGIPVLEFGGGCNFEPEELIKIGETLGIKRENLEIQGNKSENLNKIITQALVKKSSELTSEVRERFLKTLPDKSVEMIDMKTIIKNKGIEHCDKLLVCEFTTDLIPQVCTMAENSKVCPSDYICCDRYQRDNKICPEKAYDELMRYIKIEENMGRKVENGYCVHIVSAHKATARTAAKTTARQKRSLGNYWRSGGILNVLTGGYTDEVVEIEEIARIKEDKRLEKDIERNRNIMIKMNVQFNDLQMRLNEHVCQMTKNIIENLLHFEANVIFQETKMQIDNGMHTCWEGFLPLSIPISKLTAICRGIMGDSDTCFYPYNLFRCENTGLWVNHNSIVHRVKVTFIKPMSDFEAIKVHVLPVPDKNNKNEYVEIDTKSKIIFKNNKIGLFTFGKCENRRIFSLCEIGSENEILNDECMIGILNKNETIIRQKCTLKRVTGNSCVYRTIKGNIILSSHETVSIYKKSDKNVEFMSDNLVKKQKGLFVIENRNVKFQCGLVTYTNEQLPKINIFQSKFHLKMELTELPIKHTEIMFNEPQSDTIFNLKINNISFLVGIFALVGVIFIFSFKIRKYLKIKIKSWELQKLRNQLLNRPELRRNVIQRQSRRESFESIQLD